MISNAEKILWVGKILFPTYYRAKRALDKIDANEILNRGDPGFEEIEKIVKSHLVTVPQNKGKEKIIQASDLIKLGHPMGVALFGPGQFDSNLGVKMQYQSHEIDFDDYKHLYEQLVGSPSVISRIIYFFCNSTYKHRGFADSMTNRDPQYLRCS